MPPGEVTLLDCVGVSFAATYCPVWKSYPGKREEPKVCSGQSPVSVGVRGIKSSTAARQGKQLTPDEGLALPGWRSRW